MLESPNKTVDENWEDFKSVLLKGMNMFIPKGKKSPIKSKKNFHPFNIELQQLIHKKHRLWNHWIASRNKLVYKEYKKIHNKVKSVTVKLTQQEQGRISMECKRNPQKIWQYVNRHTKSKSDIGDLQWHDKNGEEKIAESDDDKATILQNFFSSVYTVEPDPNDFDTLPSRMAVQVDRTTFTVTEDDIYKKLIQ